MSGYAGRDAVIVEAVRTPIGKGRPGGGLHQVLPVDLLAHTLTELVHRSGVDPTTVDDVIAGAVTQVGDQAVNIARNAWLAAGFPETVPATTVDRQCGSSQQAIAFAAQGVLAGAYDLVIAAGVEALSGRAGAAGRQRRTHRGPLGAVPPPARRVLRGQPREGRAGDQGGPVRPELAPVAGLDHDEIIRP